VVPAFDGDITYFDGWTPLSGIGWGTWVPGSVMIFDFVGAFRL
jgi:energy-converting hydrogenase Eha subunit G